jgi:hypothetical protein
MEVCLTNWRSAAGNVGGHTMMLMHEGSERNHMVLPRTPPAATAWLGRDHLINYPINL